MKAKIAELSEEVTELQFAEKSLMQAFSKSDATQMKEVEGEISKSEARIVKLDAQEIKFTGAISREKEKFDELKEQAANLDQDELDDARLALRPQMEDAGGERIRRATGGREISFWKFHGSIRNADDLLGEEDMAERHEERKRLRRMADRQRQKRETRERQQER